MERQFLLKSVRQHLVSLSTFAPIYLASHTQTRRDKEQGISMFVNIVTSMNVRIFNIIAKFLQYHSFLS